MSLFSTFALGAAQGAAQGFVQGTVNRIQSEMEEAKAKIQDARAQTMLKWSRASTGQDLPPMVTLQLLGGRKEKIRPGDVLGALTGDGGLPAALIGKINVNEFSTYVAVDRAIAHDALRKLNAGKVKGKSVRVRFLEQTTQ